MILIGIAGEIGAGKDTAADIIVRYYGFRKVTIGKHIRNELCRASDLLAPGRHIPASVRALLTAYGISGRTKRVFAKPTTLDVREALQWFGEYKVQSDPMYWISRVTAEIKDSGSDKVVWCDIRRPSEFDIVKSMGGQVWRVNRTLVRKTVGDIKAMQHITETALKAHKFDAEIPNNQTITKLGIRLQRLMRSRFKLDLPGTCVR